MNPNDYHVFKGGRDFVVARDVAEAEMVLDLYGCIDEDDEVELVPDDTSWSIHVNLSGELCGPDDDDLADEGIVLTARQFIDREWPEHCEAFWLCREE